MSRLGKEGGSPVGEASATPYDYTAIERAVMESQRGRWFLEEYAKRVRSGETAGLLHAISKLENAIAANQDMITQRLGKALGVITAVDSRLAQIPALSKDAARPSDSSKYFKQDEDLFESEGEPESVIPALVPDAPQGARLVIKRRTEPPAIEDEIAAAMSSIPADPVEMPAEFFPPSPPEIAEAPPEPKRRIVIIRHKPGEEIDVPLQEELRAG